MVTHAYSPGTQEAAAEAWCLGSEMAQWVKELITKSDGLHFVPRTHTVEKPLYFYKLSSDLHDRHWHVCPRPSTEVSKERQFKIISLHNKFKVNPGYETCLKNQN